MVEAEATSVNSEFVDFVSVNMHLGVKFRELGRRLGKRIEK